MTQDRIARMRATLSRRQTTLTVLMENVHKPHNYSAILRSCDAVGVGRVHAVATDLLVQRHRKTSASAAEWVEVEVHSSIGEACTALHGEGLRLVAAHPDGSADFRDFDYTKPTALVLGAERDGLSREALDAADVRVRIDMRGLVRSLNVSVAAALLLFEAERQRRAAGMYDRPWLAPAEQARLLFEWAQPEIARYCRAHALPYPPLDDDGDIAGDFRKPAP